MDNQGMKNKSWFYIPKEEFTTYKGEIDKSNLHSIKTVSLTGLLFGAVLVLLSLPFVHILTLIYAYTALAAIFLVVFLLALKVFGGHSDLVVPAYYVLMIMLLSTGIVMGTSLGITTNATTFLLFMLLLPLFIIDKPWRMNFVLFTMSILFCIAALNNKSGKILSLDISNTIIVCIVTMILYTMNIKRRFYSFWLVNNEKKRAFEKDKFINNIPTGIGIFEIRDGETRQTFMNDGFFRLVEDSRETRESGSGFIKSIHPEDRQRMIDNIEQVKQGENYVSTNVRAKKGDGSYKWIRVTSSVAKRENNLILVYTAYDSMEEEMRSRLSMERSWKILEAAAESVDMTVWEYDCLTKSITQTQNSIDKHGFASVIENAPESLIESGYVHETSVMAFRRMYQDLFDKKEAVQGDFYVQLANKNGYWWEHIILTPVFDENGDLIKAVGTSLDITERKNKEEQYYNQIGIMSENGERNLVSKAQFNLSTRGVVSYVAVRDDAIPFNAGDSYDALLERLINEETNQEGKEIISAGLKYEKLLHDYSRGRNEGSIQYKRKNGGSSFMYVELKYLISENPKTDDIMLFVYCYDNTRHVIEQRIVEQLGTSEYESIGVIDVESGDYLVERANGDYVTAVPAAGHDYLETFRRTITSAVVPEEREEMLAKAQLPYIISRLQKNDIYEFPYTITDTEGKYHRKKLRYQYLDSKQTTILCTCTDITELYKQEQDRLDETKKALAAAKLATQAKTDFLSRMSHDIRTPLNAILGTTALAKDEINDACAIEEYLATIDSSGHFLLGLINDILDINKIESGKIELRPEKCLVSDYVKGMEASIRPLMDKKHIDFQLKMECGFKTIFVDKVRHNQVFFNLLSNAAKYTPEYGRVEYSTKRIEAPKDYVGIRNIVKDNGIGMTEEYLDHLFEPFSRDTNAVINQTEGSGLGLAIVKNIVDAMGGRITVKSRLNEGTEFTVDLFLPEIDETIAAPDEEISTDDGVLRNKHILLVEDNLLNTKIAVKLLEKKGCIVDVAANGREAVNYMTAADVDSVDMILMDIRMPLMNGLEATKAIRNMERKDANRIPIIAMTADAFSEDIVKMQEVGMNGHIPKPVEPERLYNTMLMNL